MVTLSAIFAGVKATVDQVGAAATEPFTWAQLPIRASARACPGDGGIDSGGVPDAP